TCGLTCSSTNSATVSIIICSSALTAIRTSISSITCYGNHNHQEKLCGCCPHRRDGRLINNLLTSSALTVVGCLPWHTKPPRRHRGPAETYTIAEVSEFLGITANTSRYYERGGLIEVPRSHGTSSLRPEDRRTPRLPRPHALLGHRHQPAEPLYRTGPRQRDDNVPAPTDHGRPARAHPR